MMRRYRSLALLVVALAIAIAIVARLPRSRPAAAPEPPPVQTIPIALVVERGLVSPASCSVPKDCAVQLRIVNRDAQAVALTLTGYEDRVSIPALAPGAERSLAFTADRPGEDFEWQVQGRDAGRFAVVGSHLVEGHR